MEMVIYKENELYIQTFIMDNGKPAYCDDISTEDYLDQLGPEYKLITMQEALNKIAEVEEKTLIGSWEKITEDEWEDALECLPPLKWKSVINIEFFGMSEAYTGNIRMFYAKNKVTSNCYKAMRRDTTPYINMAHEILKLEYI
jgi:hypothetical protein